MNRIAEIKGECMYERPYIREEYMPGYQHIVEMLRQKQKRLLGFAAAAAADHTKSMEQQTLPSVSTFDDGHVKAVSRETSEPPLTHNAEISISIDTSETESPIPKKARRSSSYDEEQEKSSVKMPGTEARRRSFSGSAGERGAAGNGMAPS